MPCHRPGSLAFEQYHITSISFYRSDDEDESAIEMDQHGLIRGGPGRTSSSSGGGGGRTPCRTPGTPRSGGVPPGTLGGGGGARRSGRGSLASLGSSGGGSTSAAAVAVDKQPSSPYIRSLSNTTPLSPGGRSLMGGQGQGGNSISEEKKIGQEK